MIDWHIQAESYGTCNCDHWCPCQFEGDPTHYGCEGIEAYRVTKGHFGDVDLTGVVVAHLYTWPGPVYKGGGTMQTIVGEGASPEQVNAIERIARGEETREAANVWWVFHAMSDHVLETLVKPFKFEVDIEARRGLIEIPGLLRSVGEPIRNPHDGGEHRVQIRCPDGIEFEIAEIGNANTQASGQIKLDLKDTYGQFNYLDHTGEARHTSAEPLTSMLERLLRRDRNLVAAALILVTTLSWAWIFAGAGMGMSGFEMTRHSNMGMDMMPEPAWDVAYILLMFFMWWIMMIAMMLPSATPVILLAAALNRRSESSKEPYGSAASFATGYLLAWAAFSAIAVAMQWALLEIELISGMLRSTSQTLSAALLIAAGAWQFTTWKHSCLRHCRGPIEYLTTHRREGNTGAMLMGVHHGLYCLGCCWFLMALLFVGGVMNLYWIAGLAIYVWVEKILPSGEAVSRVMGGVLIAWGIAILASALYT